MHGSIFHGMPQDDAWCPLHPTPEEGLENQNRLEAVVRQKMGLPFVADANAVNRQGGKQATVQSLSGFLTGFPFLL